MNSLKEQVLNAAIDEFSKKGLKFTMDDVSRNLGISKKTLYNVFDSKEEMLLAVVDYCFSDIKRSEQAILVDPEMDVVDKIRNIIIVLPERYRNIGLANLYQLKDKLPGIYSKLEKYLQTDWDATITLINSGIAQGRIKNISIPVLKTMIESTIAEFFASNVLVDNNIPYEKALEEMIDIIMDGITIKN